MRALYTLAWWLAAPLVLLRLLWRARRQTEYLRNLGERLGVHRAPPPQAPLLWIHAVSVGETRAAQPLIRALLAHYPQHTLLLTQMTPTGRATAQELFGADLRVRVAYLPYDTPGCMRRFLRHFRPSLGLLMETEVWPNLLAVAQQERVPMLLINARLSPRSARGYARLGRFARDTFSALTAVGAQTEADAQRLAALGAPPLRVTGNLKFEVTPPADQLERGQRFRAHIGPRPVLLAASTREGEEDALLAAVARHAPPELLLILVPRHPQRFDAVAQLAARHGLRLQKRSSGGPIAPDTRVWLGDSMGELFAYYAAADLAIIGGSWEPLGGQNLIEACAAGIPALVGPHTFNFTQATQDAIAAGAAFRCDNLDAALTRALALLADPAQRTQAGAAGRQFAAAHRGALAATLEMIDAQLHATSRP